MRWLAVILLSLLLLPVQAQQMQVTDFHQIWKGPLNIRHVVIEKKMATLDLVTTEKGFTFLADGVTELQAEEGDKGITLKVPHKTKFLLIKHDAYGQLYWKVPGSKGLKKKKRYEAQLLTESLEKDYKLESQWVVFDILPENAIVYVDSTQTVTRNGRVQLELAVGKHPYRVESPFHDGQDGMIEVTDTAKLFLNVSLQPIYSYITVKTPQEGGEIQIDGKTIGYTEATSGRLTEGVHRLTVMKGDVCWYEDDVKIGKAEKKSLTLKADDFYPRWRKKVVDFALADGQMEKAVEDRSVAGQSVDTLATVVKEIMAQVTITAPNDSTEIWLNREFVGTGKWEGQLPLGFYAVTTRSDDLESSPQYIWVYDENPVQLDLPTTMAHYGFLNIHSNEVDAIIYINGKESGHTPCMTEKLLAGKTYKIRISKPGFKDAHKNVKVIGNTLTDVEMKMKKSKKR
ncbi:MAG: PEGA domain-containing protein [Bacteroidaceae bacterium]|nr:PEGA domain-containing protein [Bacteroidaceae bacterium]